MMSVNKLPEFLENVKKMSEKCVMVGVPHDKDSRTDGKETNAQVAMLQEFGSGAKNIPPRPFLIPGIKMAQKEVAEILKDGAKNALHGGSIEVALNKAGLIGQNHVKDQIRNGDFKPLAKSTLEARRDRRKNGRAGTKPLIDTGQLLNSITYVVRENE
jgi:hypothetical protein